MSFNQWLVHKSIYLRNLFFCPCVSQVVSCCCHKLACRQMHYKVIANNCLNSNNQHLVQVNIDKSVFLQVTKTSKQRIRCNLGLSSYFIENNNRIINVFNSNWFREVVICGYLLRQ